MHPTEGEKDVFIKTMLFSLPSKAFLPFKIQPSGPSPYL